MAYMIEAIGTKDKRASLVIKNGVIEAPDRAIHAVDCDVKLERVQINAAARCIGAYNNCKIEIDNECVLTTSGDDACVFLYSDAGRTDAKTELILSGTLNGMSEAAGAWTLCGNGSSNHGTTSIVINEGAKVVSMGDSAIYHPQGGTLVVNGGTIEGKDGIYMKSGSLIVNGGDIKGNGEGEYTYSGDGTEGALGHGVVMEFTNYPAGLATLEVNGGNITSEKKDAIGYYVSPKCANQNLEELIAENVKINK